MEQRDLLKDQIEQLGKALGKILANFLALKSKGQVSQGIETTHQQLQNQLDIDMDKVAALNKEELQAYLAERKLTAEHLEVLSTYLSEVGESQLPEDKQEAKQNLTKAIELLEIADEISKTTSFDRIRRYAEIETMLRQCR